MNLKQLAEMFLTSYSLEEALDYLSNQKIIDNELSQPITDLFIKFNRNELITESEFNQFMSCLNSFETNCPIKKVIIYFLFYLAFSNYEIFEKELTKNLIPCILENIKDSKEIPHFKDQDDRFNNLINAYYLFEKHLSPSAGYTAGSFPNILKFWRPIISCDIPFALNVFHLTGLLSAAKLNQLALSTPFYPCHLKITKETKLVDKPDVIVSAHCFPIKFAHKIFKGDKGNNTFIATNGREIFYIRGVEKYSPTAIFASRIATLLSAEHFSSEQLMDNGLVASPALQSYVVSTAEPKISKKREQYINEQNIFPGTGLADEVSNFLRERDLNAENLGLTSQEMDKAHLCKIDFDGCSLITKISAEEYEKDIFTRPQLSIYHGAPHVHNNKNYIDEKLYARLKLILIPRGFFISFADMAFMENNIELKYQIIEECINRQNIALDLFLKNSYAKTFLDEHKNIFAQIRTELTTYCKEHFSQDKHQDYINSIEEKIKVIESKVTEFFTPLPRRYSPNFFPSSGEKASNTVEESWNLLDLTDKDNSLSYVVSPSDCT